MTDDALCAMSLVEAAERVRSRQVSPVELTEACLQSIDREDGNINSFISLFPEEALKQARAAEQEITSGKWRGPLHGIPVSLKDLIDVKGKVTTAASAVLLDNVATDDAPIVARLRAAGGVILGKNNLHEFAYGGSGVISHFGPVKNPRDPTRITGGSSSGSAAAVAAGFCFASIGTDTAGSIRLPAACCGIVGFKPGYARVSAHGVVPLSWSYDHVGPLARSVEDASLVLQAISDWNPSEVQVSDLRIGIAQDYFFDHVDPEILKAVEGAVRQLRRDCRSVRDVVVPVDEDRTVFSSEAWTIHKEWVQQKPELYQPPTLQRVRAGERYSLEQIQPKRGDLEQFRSQIHELFHDVDVIVTPTSPILPPTFSELKNDPQSLRAKELLMLRNTRPWNVYGIPAISIPCGALMGIQLAALDEDVLIAAARVLG